MVQLAFLKFNPLTLIFKKKLLSTMSIDGRPKIIYLKSENSPFVTMMKNYDFVVVW